MTRVLLVEDAVALRRTLALHLRGRGLDVTEAADGETALRGTADDGADLWVLDLGLPGIGGLEALRRLRRFSLVPVIVLSARDRRLDKVAALEAGADDYVTKPFDPEELFARIRAVLRRGPSAPPRPAVVAAGGIEFDTTTRRVRRHGTPLRLTPTELALLEELVTNPGGLVTHDQLEWRIWGDSAHAPRGSLRVHMAGLRRKLGDDAASPRLILTEPGAGYRWLGEDGW